MSEQSLQGLPDVAICHDLVKAAEKRIRVKRIIENAKNNVLSLKSALEQS